MLDAFRRWQPLDSERQALCDLDKGDPAWDARFDAYTEQWHDLTDEIAAMPARTPEGIQAKATVLRALLLNHTGDGSGRVLVMETPAEAMAFALVHDIVGGAGA